MALLFEDIEVQPEDPILSIPEHFAMDTNPHKVNLGIGSYRDDQNKPVVLKCVREAEKRVLAQNGHKEYLPIEGLENFRRHSLELVFGKAIANEKKGLIASYQSVGGMSALRTGAEFLTRNLHTPIYIPDPTWGGHNIVFTYAGFDIFKYPYYDFKTHRLDFSGFYKACEKMAPRSVVLLHACAHNPSGIDPAKEQWRELSYIFKQKELIPFFDFAYQGFKDSLEEDAYPIRLFAEEGHELLVSNSYSKNFGLYGERAGMLSILAKSEKEIERIEAAVKRIIRATYSNPPLHGARIVSEILQDSELKKMWTQELTAMRKRINGMRYEFMQRLIQADLPIDFHFLNNQKGFFSFCGLDLQQVRRLRNEFGIHMPENGRINVAGLNSVNIEYVTNAFKQVLRT